MPLSQYILFFNPIGFFDLIWLFLLVDIGNNYLILCQFGYFLSRILFWDIWIQGFNGLTLTFDFWPLADHLGSRVFPWVGIPYITSYVTSIDTFSVSRTVLEIFDFKVLKVWPWPLTFTSKPTSKICSSFEIPYMTSYLTSIDTCSLSRTVFEIFNFKVFRVWPWPLTFGVTLGQKKKFHQSKAHIWLRIQFPLALSLYLVPFSRYSTSKFLGFDLDLWPLGVTWGWRYFHNLEAHIWLPI